jgi:hypothetical protein
LGGGARGPQGGTSRKVAGSIPDVNYYYYYTVDLRPIALAVLGQVDEHGLHLTVVSSEEM